MKTIITISLFIGIMNSIYSQDYLPIPESNSKWINTYSELVPDPYPHFEISNIVSYCTSGLDTIINGLSYFIIDTCDSGYKGALRNENGKVWFLPKNSQTEFLLYDFTAQPGDTILNVYIETFGSSYELYDLYVGPDAIDSILIDGNYRRRISFEAGYWIEGIGNTQGLFIEPWPNISDYMVNLFCMSTNDTILFPEFSVGECESPVGMKELENNNLLLNIYPNPFNTEILVSLKKSIWDFDLGNIVILNSFGQQVNPTVRIENKIIRIEMESFPTGVYFFRFINNENVIGRKLIKK
jgi:hypothetical protein